MKKFSSTYPIQLVGFSLFLAAILGVAAFQVQRVSEIEKAAALSGERSSEPDSLRPPGNPPVDRLFVPEGLEATLWAESPLIYNPTNMDVDAKGRLWVIEAVDYRDFNNPDSTRMNRPQGERVVILEDTDGDGRADSSKTFVQDEDLVAPLGIGVLGNKVYVSASPHLFVYTDTDGDDKSDKRETLLTGFGGLDHDHGLHAVTAGPGGRLYFNAGNAGPHVVTDQAGWTLRAGSIYSGGTPYMEGNQPNLKSDDGRVWTGGVQLRMRPDGTGLEVMAHNYRNPYELAVDSYGTLWNNDNDDDGNAGTRVLYSMEGANTGYFSRGGSRTWQADRRPEQESFTAQWHQEDPGVIPAGDPTGPGAPTGIVMYEGDALGERFRGTLLSADAGRNVVYGYQPEPQGAGFALASSSFASTLPDSVVQSRGTYNNWDPESRSYWFRPSDVAVGTDGAVYVADWYDARVGGHQMQDSAGYGRIYRITPEGQNLQAPEIDLSATGGQLQALRSPAPNVRYEGFRRLKEQGASAVEDVKEVLQSDNPYHQARAVWLLAQLGPEGVQAVEEVLGQADPQLRVVAFRALRQVQEQEDVLAHAQELAGDSSSAVRREVAIFLRDVPLEKSKDAMVELARKYEGGDRWALEAFGLAAEGEEAATYELLKKELNAPSDPVAWEEPWADLVWRLHPASAASALKTRAQAPALSWEEKKQALVALGFINDRAALGAMEELAGSGQPKVAERAQWWLDYRRTNEWHDLKDWRAEERTASENEALSKMQRFRERAEDGQAPAAGRAAAVDSMGGSALGGRMLASLLTDSLAKQTLTEDVMQAIRATLPDSPDRTVRVLSRHYLPRQSERETPSAERVAQIEGDAEQGRMLFYSKCAVCHRAGPSGGEVGPDLTGVKSMFNRTGLADAILYPSSGLAHGFYAWEVRTKEGEVIYGFLLAENEETIIIKDANGQQHVVSRGRVASRKRLGEVSLMPGPEELELSEQDVADLTTFLMTLEEQNASSSE